MKELDKARQIVECLWTRSDCWWNDKELLVATLDAHARTAELTAYLEACQAVEGERIHYPPIADSGSYNRAIDRAIAAIRRITRFAELRKSGRKDSKMKVFIEIRDGDWSDDDVARFVAEAKEATGISVEVGRPIDDEHSDGPFRTDSLSSEYFTVRVES